MDDEIEHNAARSGSTACPHEHSFPVNTSPYTGNVTTERIVSAAAMPLSVSTDDHDHYLGLPSPHDSLEDKADDRAAQLNDSAPNRDGCVEGGPALMNVQRASEDDGPTSELLAMERQIDATLLTSEQAARPDASASTCGPLRPPASSSDDGAETDEFESPLRQIAVGSTLRSRYVLEESIGQGGDSIVFRARDLHRASSDQASGSYVAVKVLLPKHRGNQNALTRLKREFRQMQILSHPGIVRVFDLDCDGDIWFMTMELVAAQTVKTWMQTAASHAEAVRIIGACCEALEYAHSLGILHGDLKPTNVLLAEDGTVKLIDFGSALSPASASAAASDPSLAATPSYASPQILSGSSAERRDDIFSLACLSYSILSGGGHPFGHKSSLEACGAQMAPIYLPRIPARLFEVIERALSPERERRPASVGKFLRDLISTDLRRWTTPVSEPVIPPRASSSLAERRSAATPPASGSPPIDATTRAAQSAERAVTATLPAISDRQMRRRVTPWRVQRYLTLVVLAVLVLGAAVGLLHAPRSNVTPAVALSTPDRAADPAVVIEAAAPMTAQSGVAAAADSENFPEALAVPHEAGVISFEEPTVHVSAGQSLVAISVKRLQSTRGSAAFAWRVEGGTAQADVDYERVEPRIARFIDGQGVRSLFIALIKNRASISSRVPRSFTVTLEKVAGGPALGRVPRVTVTIEPPPLATRSAVYQARAED